MPSRSEPCSSLAFLIQNLRRGWGVTNEDTKKSAGYPDDIAADGGRIETLGIEIKTISGCIRGTCGKEETDCHKRDPSALEKFIHCPVRSL